MKKYLKFWPFAAILVLVIPLSVYALTGGISRMFSGLQIYDSTVSMPTPGVAASAGELYVEGDIETDANLNVAGTSTLTGATTATAAITANGGVAATSLTASTYLTATYPAIKYDMIRFCGNGPGNGTAATSYMGPVQFAADVTFIDAGAGCNGLDNATIGNVDDAYARLANVAFYPVAMVCHGVCTSGAAPDDASSSFTLMDDAAAITAVTCSIALTANAVAKQCSVNVTSPAVVAAGSLLAIKMINTNDDCDDAGDSYGCDLFITY